jgi:serine/threonine protein phosphatase 1
MPPPKLELEWYRYGIRPTVTLQCNRIVEYGGEMSYTYPLTDPQDRIYAIGDVHGCFDQLRELVERIGEDNAKRDDSLKPFIIFMGDMVDRGHQSAQVIEFVFQLVKDNSNVLALRGNHEQVLCDIAGGSTEEIAGWLRMGGRRTLRSYGIDPDWALENQSELASALTNAMASDHLNWLRQLPLTARSGDYFFCHAGVKPGLSLARQRREDLLWIRDEFLDSTADHGAIIVHGHNIVPEVRIERNQIAVDTGAYKTGRLSAVMLERDQTATLTTCPVQSRT